LLDHQFDNYVKTLKMSNAATNFNILTISLSVLLNFDSSTKLLFWSVSS